MAENKLLKLSEDGRERLVQTFRERRRQLDRFERADGITGAEVVEMRLLSFIIDLHARLVDVENELVRIRSTTLPRS